MENCVFCKIIKGDIKSDKVYEDDDLVAFNDIGPQAPTHVLIVPKRHIPTIQDIDEGDRALIGKIYLVAKQLAKERGLDRTGYRVVANCLKDAGQAVFHIHFHLLGGRKLGWPPG